MPAARGFGVGALAPATSKTVIDSVAVSSGPPKRRPWRFTALTVAVVAALVAGIA
jgi:hypothetical protein